MANVKVISLRFDCDDSVQQQAFMYLKNYNKKKYGSYGKYVSEAILQMENTDHFAEILAEKIAKRLQGQIAVGLAVTLPQIETADEVELDGLDWDFIGSYDE